MTVQTLLSQQNISTVRWQLANSFCSSAYNTPLTVYPVLTKTSISAGALSPVNILTRRVETDNNVLLQVRDESSFHSLMLLAIQFELIRNVLEFSFKISKAASVILSRYCILSSTWHCELAFIKHFGCSKLGTRASLCNGCSERSALFC